MKRPLTVNLPEDLIAWLKAESLKEDRSVSSLVTRMLQGRKDSV